MFDATTGIFFGNSQSKNKPTIWQISSLFKQCVSDWSVPTPSCPSLSPQTFLFPEIQHYKVRPENSPTGPLSVQVFMWKEESSASHADQNLEMTKLTRKAWPAQT